MGDRADFSGHFGYFRKLEPMEGTRRRHLE